MYSRFDYIEATRETGARFVELVRTVPDPDHPLTSTPGWTISDLVGHVACAPSRFLALSQGEGSCTCCARDLPDYNAKQIANLATRNLGALTGQLLDDLDLLLDTVTHFGARVPMMNFDGSHHIRADAALGLLIGEFVVHGHDIAREVGIGWAIDPAVCPLISRGRHHILPGWVDGAACIGHSATYDIRLRGSDERFVYEFTDGHLQIDPSEPRPADVHISVEPVTALLAGYGRISPAWAAVTGRAFAWGARPWLAAGLGRRFLPA